MVVFILNTATGSGWLSPWDPPLQWGKVRERIYRPATHPIHFAADSPDKIHRCAAWAVFFFFTNKILCSCSIFQNLFSVVDRTTSKCYSCAWKKQDVVSALRPAFFILNLENFMSRPNAIPTFRQRRCTNRGRNFVRSKRWPTYMSRTTSTYFLRLNNSETFVENAFWAQR